MNKQLTLATLLSSFFITSVCGQTGEKKGWPSAERYSFISECVNSAKSLGTDTARFYCYCMQEKMEAKYPDIKDAAKVTEKDLGSDEWKKEIQSCLAGTWTKAQREEFLNSCIGTAKKDLGDEKSKNYCECMLYKIEKIYPNAEDAAKLSDEDLKSAYWKKIIQDCLDF